MLVLSRKVGEEIVMPEQGVTVTVVAVRGNRVRIGVTAPKGVTVFRKEIEPAGESHIGCAADSCGLSDS